MRAIGKAGILLALLFAALYILPLGVRPLFVPDETRYAAIPREMAATGNWAVPHLNGIRYFEKPVLGYWLNALSILAFGENRFAVRLPSALAVGAQVVLLVWWLRRLAGHAPGLAASAALIFLLSAEVLVVGTYNVLDSMFAGGIAAALVSFYAAHVATARRARRAALAAFGVCCGLGFMVKGFAVFAVVVAVVGPFLLWERQWRRLFTWPWLPLAAAAAVALPWGLCAHAREPDFWHYFFWVEHIRRFFEPLGKGQHPEPVWYFVPVLLIGALPWTFLFPAAAAGLRQRGWREPAVRFALCWFAFAFLFFSLSKGKLGTYILPCFAPLAVLLAAGIETYAARARQPLLTGGLVLMAVVFAGAALAGPVVLSAGPMDWRVFGPGEAWKWALIAAACLAWAAGSLAALARRAPLARLACVAAGPALLLLAYPFVIPAQVAGDLAPEAILHANAARVTPETMIVTDNYRVSAVDWVYRRNDLYLLDDYGELKYGLSYPDTAHRFLTVADLDRLIRAQAGRHAVVWFTDRSRFKRLKAALPPPRFVDRRGRFVFAAF